MPAFSDYVIYVDESGDHDLTSVAQSYPIFVLAFCIFRKADYIRNVVPQIQEFKFRWFGHDNVILHEHEIRKQKPPFKFLQNEERRRLFMQELTEILERCPTTVIASVIDKPRLAQRYAEPDNPYHIAMQFCMERTHRFLAERGQAGRSTTIMFERRGEKEDAKLELEFRRIKDGANFGGAAMADLDIRLVDKRANSSGLQIADLFARPIGIKTLRPEQLNRAYDIIEMKFRRSAAGEIRGYGLKLFP
ncbi:MAG: DUF3800 domain-containing protein [Hyphomicrobiales bacterium]|nr:MAG: DUF3800 domain-containing protein [Hyphomicrobiales bacterium]